MSISGDGCLVWTAQDAEIAEHWEKAATAIRALLETGLPLTVEVSVNIGEMKAKWPPQGMKDAPIFYAEKTDTLLPQNGAGYIIPLAEQLASAPEFDLTPRPEKKPQPANPTTPPLKEVGESGPPDGLELRAALQNGSRRWAQLTVVEKRAAAATYLSALALKLRRAPSQLEYTQDKPEYLPTATPIVDLFGMSWRELGNAAAEGIL